MLPSALCDFRHILTFSYCTARRLTHVCLVFPTMDVIWCVYRELYVWNYILLQPWRSFRTVRNKNWHQTNQRTMTMYFDDVSRYSIGWEISKSSLATTTTSSPYPL